MFQTKNGWTKEKMKAQIRLKNNGMKSMSEDGQICMYRGKDGNACAVGCFIPDEAYNPKIESTTPYSYKFTENGLDKFMPLSSGGMASMQTVHDREAKGDVRDFLCAWVDANVVDTVPA